MPRLGFLGIFAGAGRSGRGDVSESSSTQFGRREGCIAPDLPAFPPPTPPLLPAGTTTTITTASTNTTVSSFVSSFGKGARAKERLRSPPRPCPLTVSPTGTYERPRSLDQNECWDENEPASPPASSGAVDVPPGSLLPKSLCVDTDALEPSSFERDSGKGKRGSFKDTVLRLFEEKKSVSGDSRVVRVETSEGQRTRRYRRRRERRRAGLVLDSEDEMSDYGTYVRHRRQWVDHIRAQESTDTNTDGETFSESLGGGEGSKSDALYVRAHSASDIPQKSFQTSPASVHLNKKVVPVYYLDSVDALPEPDQLLGRLGHSLDSCVTVRSPPVGESQSMCVVWDLEPDELGAGNRTPPNNQPEFEEAEREHTSLAFEAVEDGPLDFNERTEALGTETPFGDQEVIESNEPSEPRGTNSLEPLAAEPHNDPADSHPVLQEIQQRFSKWNRRSPSFTLLTLPEDIPEDGEEEQQERKPSPYPRRCRGFRSVPCSPVVPLSPSYTCHGGRGTAGLQGKGRYYSDMENDMVRNIAHRRRSKLRLSLAPGNLASSVPVDGGEDGGKDEKDIGSEDQRCQETGPTELFSMSTYVPSPVYAEPQLPDAVLSSVTALPPIPPPRPFDYLQGAIAFTRSETSSPMLPHPSSLSRLQPTGHGLQGNLFFGQDFQLGLQEWQRQTQEEEGPRLPSRAVEHQLKQVEMRMNKSNKQDHQHPKDHEYEVPYVPQRSNDRLRDSAYFSTDETADPSSQGSSGGNNTNSDNNSNTNSNNGHNLGVTSGKGPDLIREIIQKSIEENLTKLPEIIAAEINRQVMEHFTTTTTSAVQSSESEETPESAIVTPQITYSLEESSVFQPKNSVEVREPRRASNKLGINHSMTNLRSVSPVKRPTTLALKTRQKGLSYSCQNLLDDICSPGLKPLSQQQQHTALSFADLGLVNNEDSLAPVDVWPLQLEHPQAPSTSISVPCHLQDVALSEDLLSENPTVPLEEVQVEGDLSELPYKHHAPLKLALKPLCRDLSKSLKLRDEVEDLPVRDDLSKKLFRRRKKKSLLLRLKVNLDQMEGDGSDGSMEWDYYDQTDGTWCEEF